MASLDSVPGWFSPLDLYLFEWFLGDQNRRGAGGDLVEIGTYYGKSAIVIGRFLQAGETLTVIDLYEMPAADEANRGENADQYEGLTKAAFEANYLRFHDTLPTVVQGPSSEIANHVAPGSVRFCHVDASHLYEHVRQDIETTRKLLQPDGVVALDDYRSGHTPGTAAAVWEAVLNLDLEPIVLTPHKLYGTWGDAGDVQRRLIADLDHQENWLYETQEIRGRDVIRLFGKPRTRSRRALGRLAQIAPVLRRLKRS